MPVKNVKITINTYTKDNLMQLSNLTDLLQNSSTVFIVALAAMIFGAIIADALTKTITDVVTPGDYLYVCIIALISLLGVVIIGFK